MATHDAHFVTTKAAIYAEDGGHVLVNRYNKKNGFSYGLPGGHIDAGETPDQAIARELDEELGLTMQGLLHKDFFVHAGGKIVLGYIGSMPVTTVLTPSEPDDEIGEWLTEREVAEADMDEGYRRFILTNWPH